MFIPINEYINIVERRFKKIDEWREKISAESVYSIECVRSITTGCSLPDLRYIYHQVINGTSITEAVNRIKNDLE